MNLSSSTTRGFDQWLADFERNADRELAPLPTVVTLPRQLRDPLVLSLQRFQLGENNGGRLTHQIRAARDPALCPATRRIIQLYIAEEHRHARELAALLAALGARPLQGHVTETLFRKARRVLGVRTKLIVLAAAEVVGIAFYGMLRDSLAEPHLRRMFATISGEEARHLRFQRAWFGRVVALTPRPLRGLHVCLLLSAFLFTTAIALCVFAMDHRRILSALNVPARALCARAVRAVRDCAELELAPSSSAMSGALVSFEPSSDT